MKIRRLSCASAVLLLAGALGCSSLPKTAPQFDTIAGEIQAVAVMPSAFAITEVGSFSAQSIAEITHDIEVEVTQAAEQVVGAGTYRLAAIASADEDLAGSPELTQRLGAQYTELSQVDQKLAATKGKTIDLDYAADIDYFADLAGTDHLLFVQGSGWFKTTGAQVKEAVVSTALAVLFGGGPGMGPASSTWLKAYLVDAKRGKVVWYNAVNAANSDPRKPSHLSKVCQKLLKPLVGPVRIEVDKSRDEVIIDKYKAATEQPTPVDATVDEKTPR